MEIIAHKSNFYNTEEFLFGTKDTPFISGIAIDVSTTSDGYVVMFNSISSNEATLNNLQNASFKTISNNEYILLSDVLESYKDSPKKIIINILPIVYAEISNDNIESINKRYEAYVAAIGEILKKYSYLNLYVCSISEKAIYFMKDKITYAKIGTIVYSGLSSYIDVDFYAFTTLMYEEATMLEQLKRDKELMMYVVDCTDMSIILQHFDEKTASDNAKLLYQKIGFINNYPVIFYNVFKDQHK